MKIVREGKKIELTRDELIDIYFYMERKFLNDNVNELIDIYEYVCFGEKCSEKNRKYIKESVSEQYAQYMDCFGSEDYQILISCVKTAMEDIAKKENKNDRNQKH